MKKKKGGSGGANWMDTYGDMVTLLLCFFVLLYSMSTISEENWKALVMSFNPDAVQTPTETPGNDGPNADPNEEDATGLAKQQEAIDKDMEELFESIKKYIEEQGMQESVTVTYGDGKVFVTFRDVIFFNGDDATLREEGKPVLETMGNSLSRVAASIDEVRIMGHTAQALPDRPNTTEGDRALSALRASNALSYLQDHCTVDKGKLISEGYGQWHPLTGNRNEEERAKNRRVEMMISGRNIEEELKNEQATYDIKSSTSTVSTVN